MSRLPPASKICKFSPPFKSFHLLSNWNPLSPECDFECLSRISGSNVFVSLHNIEGFALHRNVHASFHLGRLLWCAEYNGCRVLTVSASQCFRIAPTSCFVSHRGKVLTGALQSSRSPSLLYYSSLATGATVLIGSFLTMTVCIVAGREFGVLSPLGALRAIEAPNSLLSFHSSIPKLLTIFHLLRSCNEE